MNEENDNKAITAKQNTEQAQGENNTDTHQNASFYDAQQATLESWIQQGDPTMLSGSTPDLTLSEFLSRPIRIHTYEWHGGPTGNFAQTFNPWRDYILHSNVQSKLRNFANFRGNMNVKFVINGSPFYYGRMMVSVIPFETTNTPWGYVKNNSVGAACRVAYQSQGQHGYLDPSTNGSLDLKIPFMSVKNWARLYSTSAATASDLVDLTALPSVVMTEINPLRVGNAAQSVPSVNITIFAWLSEVEMEVPTSSEYTAQAKRSGKKIGGPKADQEEADSASQKATISPIASAVANGLDMLEDVPVIGPFAKAGSMVASTISNIAKIFGFSRPMALADTQRLYPEVFTNLSATQGTFTGNKLTVDPKQGVTVDPRVGMFNAQDEMTLRYIACKESLFTSVTWRVEAKPGTDTATIINVAVMPSVFTRADAVGVNDEAGNPYEFLSVPSPLAFAVTPFYYWKGTLKYRFQMVASQYHRGKLAIWYDPNVATSQNTNANFDMNSHLVDILDLQDVDNHTFEVPWYSSRPMLEVGNFNSNVLVYNTDTIEQTFPQFSANANGFFRVVVINELQAATVPVPEVEINIFVSCDDLQVWYPANIERQRLGNPIPLSGFRAQADVGGFDLDQTPTGGLIGGTVPTPDDSLVFFGERIVSFRPLVKRFNGEIVTVATLGPTGRGFIGGGSIYPDTTYLSGKDQKTPLVPLVSMFEYLRYAYVGCRGGMRRVFRTRTTRASNGYYSVSNFQTSSFGFTGTAAATPGASQTLTIGTAINPALQNDGIMFETPYYSMNRFFISIIDGYQFLPLDYMTQQVPGYFISVEGNEVETGETVIYIDQAAADDFAFMGFQAAPPRFSNS